MHITQFMSSNFYKKYIYLVEVRNMHRIPNGIFLSFLGVMPRWKLAHTLYIYICMIAILPHPFFLSPILFRFTVMHECKREAPIHSKAITNFFLALPKVPAGPPRRSFQPCLMCANWPQNGRWCINHRRSALFTLTTVRKTPNPLWQPIIPHPMFLPGSTCLVEYRQLLVILYVKKPGFVTTRITTNFDFA